MSLGGELALMALWLSPGGRKLISSLSLRNDRMKARHLLLTHFSARYPKLPPLTRPSSISNEEEHEPTVAIAFDLATLRLDEFWKMEHYREPMDTLFGWDEAEEDGEVLASLEKEVKSAKKEGKVGKEGMVVDEVGK